MYSYAKDDVKGSKTAKGIKKVVILKDIKIYENYKDVLFNFEQNYHTMKTTWSNNINLEAMR